MDIIEYLYNTHKENAGELKYTIEQLREFYDQHKPSDIYKMVNRDKSYVICKVAYFPLDCTYDCNYDREGNLISSELKYFNDLRALVEIEVKGGIDFREVPVHYLEKTSEVETL